MRKIWIFLFFWFESRRLGTLILLFSHQYNCAIYSNIIFVIFIKQTQGGGRSFKNLESVTKSVGRIENLPKRNKSRARSCSDEKPVFNPFYHYFELFLIEFQNVNTIVNNWHSSLFCFIINKIFEVNELCLPIFIFVNFH